MYYWSAYDDWLDLAKISIVGININVPVLHCRFSQQTIKLASPMNEKKQLSQIAYTKLKRPRQQIFWKTKVFHNVPWVALLSLFGAVLLSFAAWLILQHSNNKPQSRWPTAKYQVQPTVLLAIVTVLSNALLRIALCEGNTIVWWRRALFGGTVGDLYLQWAFGHSLWDSILSGRHTSLMSLAKVITTLAAIQGRFL
jgi:hypothetical protein